MKLTVLSVAFPFAPVHEDPIGGAEQVLAQLDRALVAAGHRSIVIAAAGSRCAGMLVAVPCVRDVLDDGTRRATQCAVREAIDNVLAREPIDLIHLHGSDFDAYLPPYGPPVLVTLHLPLSWYAPMALRPRRAATWLLPVSRSQARSAPPGVALLPPIENGVMLHFPHLRKHNYVLALGRICEEKGFHDALDAAHAADVPLLLAGAVFPWPSHQRYFGERIAPRLDARRRFIGAVDGTRKRRLLAAARCVLVPSRVAETSSLVAMEALAAGTPVIAYPNGALPDIVAHGETGFIVDDVPQMARAIADAGRIDPQTCRRAAHTRFAVERMTAAYLALYAQLVNAPQRSAASW